MKEPDWNIWKNKVKNVEKNSFVITKSRSVRSSVNANFSSHRKNPPQKNKKRKIEILSLYHYFYYYTAPHI